MSGVYEFASHPYPANILFVPSKKAWKKLMDSMGLDEPYPTSAGRCTVFDHANRMMKIVVTLSLDADTRTSSEVIGLMVHELVHVSQFLQELTGKRFDQETEPYLMQAMLMWLLDSYASAGRTFKDKS
jgi:hypothetical protein